MIKNCTWGKEENGNREKVENMIFRRITTKISTFLPGKNSEVVSEVVSKDIRVKKGPVAIVYHLRSKLPSH